MTSTKVNPALGPTGRLVGPSDKLLDRTAGLGSTAWPLGTAAGPLDTTAGSLGTTVGHHTLQSPAVMSSGPDCWATYALLLP